jgi:hypothetical protein
MLFNLQVWIRVFAMAQRRAPASLPAKIEFFVVMVTGLMARSNYVGIHLQAAIVEIQDQPVPMAQYIPHGFGQIGPARHARQAILQPELQAFRCEVGRWSRRGKGPIGVPGQRDEGVDLPKGRFR